MKVNEHMYNTTSTNSNHAKGILQKNNTHGTTESTMDRLHITQGNIWIPQTQYTYMTSANKNQRLNDSHAITKNSKIRKHPSHKQHNAVYTQIMNSVVTAP